MSSAGARFVELGWVHADRQRGSDVGYSERVREGDAPRQVCGSPVAAPCHQAAEAAHSLAQRNAGANASQVLQIGSAWRRMNQNATTTDRMSPP